MMLVPALLAAACTEGGNSGATGNDNGAVTNDMYATVVAVVDGDTISVDIDGRREMVRLIGVDAPETVHPTKGVQCFGPEASQFLTRLLPKGTMLRIERDVEARDAFDRLLLYVFLATPHGERLINVELVLRGFARPLNIAPNEQYRDFFVAANINANRHRRGLWRTCK
jgi:micrococcal nuclease